MIDAEGHYEGEYPEASTYMAALRARVGADYPLGLSSFPYTDYHPAFPYSVFLGPGAAQYNMPQLYWKTIGDSVDDAFVHTYVFNRAYDRPILPTGQTYLNPKPGQVRRFRRLALAHGMEGVSWWSWQHSRNRQWKAVSGKVAPIPAYRRYDSFPLLRPGVEGRPRRLGAAAARRRRLRDAGHGLLRGPDAHGRARSAGGARPAARPAASTSRPGTCCSPTRRSRSAGPSAAPWRPRPAPSSASPARGGAVVLPEPRSAGLEARAFEIPPLGGSDRP